MKLGIGTVQWGINYGIANKVGVPSDSQIKKLVKLANDNKINILDTALNYGTSKKKIAKYCSKDFKIITKVNLNSKISIKKQFDQCLNQLERKKIHGCLVHDSNHLNQNIDKWEQIVNLKTNNRKVEKIGFSLYDTNELENILIKGIIPDIVQVPYNCFNRDFEPFFEYLKKQKIEIYVRSVFFQGLFFIKPNELPKNLSSFKKHFEELDKIATKVKLSINELAVLFVTQNDIIDKVIIGFDNERQLKEVLSSIKSKKIHPKIIQNIKSLKPINRRMLNPSNWSQN